MKKILIVDDEPDICEILRFNLSAAGFEAVTVHSSEEALSIPLTDFNLVLLDVMMPGMSGFEMARLLRADALTRDIPIIFLTARDSEDDVLQGFHTGADDYVSKPFSVREVVARVKAVLGRTSSPDAADESAISCDGLVVDMKDKTVMLDGMLLQTTRTELEMLYFFLTNRGQVFSRGQLIEHIWPNDVVVTERTVDVNVARLRKKIGRLASRLTSRHGYGYIFS